MKRILVIGIVLLSLIALTGVVNAATEGKADLSGDVYIPPTLELTTSGSIANWQLEHGSTNDKTGVTVTVTNNGYPTGYHVSVSDQMEPDNCSLFPKQPGTAGHMTTYEYWGNCMLDGNWQWTYSGMLTYPVHVTDTGVDVGVSGTNQEVYRTSADGFGVPHTYSPTFRQSLDASDQPAGYYSMDGYRIILTFTATTH